MTIHAGQIDQAMLPLPCGGGDSGKKNLEKIYFTSLNYPRSLVFLSEL
jgi:hypothetical protein